MRSLRVGVVLLAAGTSMELTGVVLDRARVESFSVGAVWNVGNLLTWLAFPAFLLAPATVSKVAQRAQIALGILSVAFLGLAILALYIAPSIASIRSTSAYDSAADELAVSALALGLIARPFSSNGARRIIFALVAVAIASAVYALVRADYRYQDFEWFRFASVPAFLAAAVAMPLRAAHRSAVDAGTAQSPIG